MKVYTGYGVQKITIGISYGIARILLKLKVYTGYGVRKITIGISYGIARIFLELKVYTGYGVQKITIGISYGIARNVLSGKTELKNPIGDTHCWYWIHSVASELAKTQCM